MSAPLLFDLAGAVAFFAAASIAFRNYRVSGLLSNYWLTFMFATVLWAVWAVTEFLDGYGVYAETIDQQIQPSLLAAATGIFVVVAFYDLTHQREYQQRLELSEQRYRQLVQHFPNGSVFLYDDDHRHVMAAGDDFEAVDLTYDDIEGERPRDVFPDDLASRFHCYYDRALNGEKCTFEATIADGEFRIHVLPITDRTDTVMYGMAMTQDITELKDRERELEEKTTLLEQRNEQLRILNRIVRHDTRNDISVVTGWSEVLKDHVDEDGKAHLKRIIDSANHVNELTKTSQEFVDSIVLDRKPVVQPESLERTLDEEIEKARNKFDDASFVKEGIPGVTVWANEMLSSVFRNLLNNAVRHNDEETPEVRVSAETDSDEGTVTVRIADNGPGISDDRKEQIFGKGEQGLESEGTGIGLHLVDTLVDQFGGEVWIEDNDPKGAVFNVTLRMD